MTHLRRIGSIQTRPIEFDLEMSQRNLKSTTQEDLLAYLEQNPQSALALIYELDLGEYPKAQELELVLIRISRVSSLLAKNLIPHPSQTLEELSSYLQDEVIDKLGERVPIYE